MKTNSQAQAHSQNGSPSLQGKVTMVTGGGSGLGKALCETLAGAGAVVVAADVREEAARQVAEQIQANGGQASAIHLNVGDESEVRKVIQDIVARHGRLDIVVNNAGTDVTLPIDELKVSDWEHVLRVNLTGPFIVSKFAFEVMKERRSGQIVNIVSTAAKRVWANAAAYHASKWGLLGFSHALHVEARPCNVKVTAVIAGGMKTPFILDRFPETDPDTLQDPKNVAETVRFVLTLPTETVIPEVMVLPMRETSWP